jgi:hypothetical protein
MGNYSIENGGKNAPQLSLTQDSLAELNQSGVSSMVTYSSPLSMTFEMDSSSLNFLLIENPLIF